MINGSLCVDTLQKKADVSPLLFGHFIEFMHDCIDDGMWAQLLHNRGFEGEPTAEGSCCGWKPIGMLDHFDYALDSEIFYGREGHSQRICVDNHYGNGNRGIAQEHIRLFKGAQYTGYAWLRASSPSQASICVYDADGELIAETFFQVENEWKKYTIDFIVPNDTRTAAFEVRMHQNGTLWVDQTSLMPTDAVHGVWKEVIASIKDLEAPIIRFPGGCFADCYHWMDGVGPRDERPVRPNTHWGGLEDNSFGTDEYMMFCHEIGCEPMICINFGTGTAREAAEWVEYCNGTTDTPMGKLRAENGHSQPYNVRFWDIGNETFGDWEIGHCDSDEYVNRYTEFYDAMRSVDAELCFLACGGDANYISQEWNKTIVKKLDGKIDMLCLHMYPPQIKKEVHQNTDIYHAVVGAAQLYEQVLSDTLCTISSFCSTQKKPQVAVTEWNAGYNNSEAGREQTMEAAVFNAGLLIMFLHHAGDIALCNYSDLVNGWGGGCIRSRDGQTFGTASYHVLKFFAAAKLRHTVQHQLTSPTFDTTVQVGNVRPMQSIPYLDAAATKDADDNTVIYIVNRHLECAASITLIVDEKNPQSAHCEVITAPEASDYNTMQHEFIRAMPSDCYADGILLIPPHAVVRVIVR